MATRSWEVSRCFQFELQKHFYKITTMKILIYILALVAYIVYSAISSSLKMDAENKKKYRRVENTKAQLKNDIINTENNKADMKQMNLNNPKVKEKTKQKVSQQPSRPENAEKIETIKQNEINTKNNIHLDNVEDLRRAIITAEIINRKY